MRGRILFVMRQRVHIPPVAREALLQWRTSRAIFLSKKNYDHTILQLAQVLVSVGLFGRIGWFDNEGPYLVRHNEWRSDEVNQLLTHIDEHRRASNLLNHPLPGTKPRKRARRMNAKISEHLPLRNLPINWYNKTWLKGLTAKQRDLLGALPPSPLPVLYDAYDGPDGGDWPSDTENGDDDQLNRGHEDGDYEDGGGLEGTGCCGDDTGLDGSFE